MIVLILPWEKRLNFGHGKFRKVMEKVMESHEILKVSKSTNLFHFNLAKTTDSHGKLCVIKDHFKYTKNTSYFL